jgi:hypothetical protein
LETSRIHELLPAFSERNNVLYLALGLHSFAQDWLRLARFQAASAAPSSGDEPAQEIPESLLYFLVGLVSCAQRLENTLAASRVPPPPPAEQPASPAWIDLRRLLR